MSRAEDLEWIAHVAQRIRDQADRVEYRVGGLIDRIEALTADRDEAIRERDEARRRTSLTVADLDETLLGRLDALAAERDEARRERAEAQEERDAAKAWMAHYRDQVRRLLGEVKP